MNEMDEREKTFIQWSVSWIFSMTYNEFAS